MGVTGLLPLLKSIQRPTELKKFNGETFAVDGYGWLHRAAYSCAVELGQGKPTKKFIHAALNRVKMLKHFGVTPYMVFDGDFLPSKAATEASRAKKREEKLKLANEYLKAGKPSQAAQEFQKCIDITPEMASALIQQLKKMDIPYVVAPYEADPQLIYLERHGFVDGIISDDSDLLVFGAKRLLTKLDQYGNCIEINRRDFCACREISLTGWSDTEFRRMAIMSGCDYLNGLPGVGLKTAYRMLRKTKSPERIVRLLQFEGKRVSENYLTLFYQAELTFLHQWVFCPTKKELVHLTELDGTRTAEEMPFIGPHVEPEMARKIANGDVNPITKLPIILPATPSKRRHSQSAAAADGTTRPLSKPINSYFKGYDRIPMGEMDANCFSVDPQRLSQITDGGIVPRVFPLPRPYIPGTQQSEQSVDDTNSRQLTRAAPRTSPRLNRRRTEPISNLLASVSNSHPTQAEASARPPKKARLCDDSFDGDADGSPKKSRFFPAKKAIRKSPRKAKSDVYLMLSDDSLDEALSNLPDIEGWVSGPPKKGVSIFSDKQKDHPPTQPKATNQQDSTRADTGQLGRDEQDTSQPSNTSQDTSQPADTSQDTSQPADTSQDTSQPADTSQETGLTSVEASQQEAPNDTPEPLADASTPPKMPVSTPQITRTPPRLSLSRFTYSSKSSSTPASRLSEPSSVFSAVSTASTAPSTARTRQTPLQRMRAWALKAPASPKLPVPRKDADESPCPRGPVDPALIPLPKVDLDEMEALNKSCGSEDQIIPDSDGEEDAEDEEVVQLPTKKLNLARFAYS
ncbi:hypothetical protein V8C35DRAFT_89499 [Trichoderma chlorosporum]